MIKIKQRLNIFIDESGDFGFVNGSSELYAISFTIHESEDSITNELEYLNNSLNHQNHTGMIHLAYLIAKRDKYSSFNLEQRQKIFWTIFNFARKIPIKLKTILLDKRYMNNKSQLNKAIFIEINKFLNENKKYFGSFKKIVIYYDNGQETLATILDIIFANNKKVERRIKFDHIKKRLFQVSDMLTFIDKLDYKFHNNMPFTKAEKYFFTNKEIEYIKRKLKNKRL